MANQIIGYPLTISEPQTKNEAINFFRREDQGIEGRFSMGTKGDVLEVRIRRGVKKDKTTWKISASIPIEPDVKRDAAIINLAQTAWRYWAAQF